MSLFPLIAAGCLFVVGLGVGYVFRWHHGSRLLLALLLLGALAPWLMHHLAFLQVTWDTLAAEATDHTALPSFLEVVLIVYFWLAYDHPFIQKALPLEVVLLLGPAVVLTAALTAVAVPNWLRLVAATMPGVAFLTTWLLTFKLARRTISRCYLPDHPMSPCHIPFDNMATIWLWILSVGATGGLLAYCWPSHRRRANLSHKGWQTTVQGTSR